MGDEWVWAAKGWGRQIMVVEVVVVNTPVNVERVKELEEIQSYLDLDLYIYVIFKVMVVNSV